MKDKKSINAPQLRGKGKLCTYSLIAGALMLAGCAQRQQYPAFQRAEGVGAVSEISVPDVNCAEVLEIAEEVLAKMYFTIEKADPDSGFIKTRPLPGAQFFEFWRSDNVGSFDRALANLHSIQRTVEMDISQEDEKVHIDCNVWVYRLSLPGRQISSSTQAYEMFSRSSPLLQGLTLHPAQKKAMAWVNMGQDSRLAKEILDRIEKRIAPSSEKGCPQSQTKHRRKLKTQS